MLAGLERRRQEERERAALSDLALHMDLAAEESCDLAADGEPQTGPAEAPARCSIGLLERLEDQAQLVVRDAHAGVLDRKLEHGLGARENLAGELTPLRQADPEFDASRL